MSKFGAKSKSDLKKGNIKKLSTKTFEKSKNSELRQTRRK